MRYILAIIGALAVAVVAAALVPAKAGPAVTDDGALCIGTPESSALALVRKPGA